MLLQSSGQRWQFSPLQARQLPSRRAVTAGGASQSCAQRSQVSPGGQTWLPQGVQGSPATTQPLIPWHGIPEYGILIVVPIQGFATRALAAFFENGVVPKGAGWAGVAGVAARKLDMLDYAAKLSDLASPPGNRLEALKGSLTGLHSIRINDQWRVVFRWTPSGPTAVEIRDYH